MRATWPGRMETIQRLSAVRLSGVDGMSRSCEGTVSMSPESTASIVTPASSVGWVDCNASASSLLMTEARR